MLLLEGSNNPNSKANKIKAFGISIVVNPITFHLCKIVGIIEESIFTLFELVAFSTICSIRDMVSLERSLLAPALSASKLHKILYLL